MIIETIKRRVESKDLVGVTRDQKLKMVDFFIEADMYSIQTLWERNFYNKKENERLEWIQDYSGYSMNIGNIEGTKFTVVIQINFYIINGRLICFYNCTSNYCDYKMIEDYLDGNYPIKYDNDTRVARTDSMNFHNCLNFCKD